MINTFDNIKNNKNTKWELNNKTFDFIHKSCLTTSVTMNQNGFLVIVLNAVKIQTTLYVVICMH